MTGVCPRVHVQKIFFRKFPRLSSSWLRMLHVISLGASFVFLILSMFFAVYASIAAQSCVVRTLTQALRIPVPDTGDLVGARSLGMDFEQVRKVVLGF